MVTGCFCPSLCHCDKFLLLLSGLGAVRHSCLCLCSSVFCQAPSSAAHPLPWDRALPTSRLAPTAVIHGPGFSDLSLCLLEPLCCQPALSGDAPSWQDFPAHTELWRGLSRCLGNILTYEPNGTYILVFASR